jgi:CDP-diglyceride synthetase
MTHNLLIIGHALAGIASFVAGVLSLSLTTIRSWRFQAYLVSLIAMVVFMVGAVAWDWRDLESGTKTIYLILVGLGAVMVVRAFSAAVRVRLRDRNWQSRYIDGVGFTLISLFEGFIIVGAIDLGAPPWLVALVAVAGVVGGVWTKNRVKHRVVGRAVHSAAAR